MGVVWRAEDDGANHVALKLLHVDREEVDRKRFINEARAAAALDSPHVVRILDASSDGEPYIAMELVDGENLRDRLLRGPLGLSETAHVMSAVGEGVELAHTRNIVHRDLKPANILLGRDGSVKVSDFGVAKLDALLRETDPRTKTGDMLGTPAYMSPEQLRSSKAVGATADLWSMGAITFHCLLGQLPFPQRHFGDLVLAVCLNPLPVPSKLGAVPPGFDAWFARALSRAASERYPSAKAQTDALLTLL